MLLCRCQSRRISGPYQECCDGSTVVVHQCVRHSSSPFIELILFGSDENYGVKSLPSDNSKLAEMEFYLVDDLECDLIVFHPYRTLMTLCRNEGSEYDDAEAGELGVGIDTGTRYWGTGDGQLELQEGAMQMAWYIPCVVYPSINLHINHRFIINDTYRSELCLLYPPHLIAIAAIYLTLVLHVPTRDAIQSRREAGLASTIADISTLTPSRTPRRRSSRQSSNASAPPVSSPKKANQDIVGFFAELNVSMPLIATIAQEIISLYTLWDRYKEDGDSADPAKNPSAGPSSTSPLTPGTGSKRTLSGSSRSGSQSNFGTPADGRDDADGSEVVNVVTPVFLTQLLVRMKEDHAADVAHPASGRPVAVNKMLERTQAAG